MGKGNSSKVNETQGFLTLASSSLVVQLRFQLRFGNTNAIGTLTKEQNCKFQLHLHFRGSICVSGVP